MYNKGIRFFVKKALLTAFSVLCLLPVGFAVVQALQYGGQFSFRQFEEILLYRKEFFAWFWNSVLYATAILAIQLPLSALAGYAFAQNRDRLMGAVFTLYIFCDDSSVSGNAGSAVSGAASYGVQQYAVGGYPAECRRCLRSGTHRPVYPRDRSGHSQRRALRGRHRVADIFAVHSADVPPGVYGAGGFILFYELVLH